MSLKKYGCIFVSAGIAITGALLWDNNNRRALAESEAELLAAAVERRQIAYAFGDAVPYFSSNNVVGPRKDWRVIYGKTMAEARDMITNNTKQVLWVEPDAAIEDGDIIASGGGTYYIELTPRSNAYLVVYSGATNATTLFNSTGSHIADPRYTYMPDVGTNDVLPVATKFFGHDTRPSTAPIFGGANNWWPAIGIDTNIYKYGCEHWRGIEGVDIAVTPVGGAGFTNTASSLHLPYPALSSSALSVISTGTNLNSINAQLYKLSSPLKDDAYIVASDGASSGLNTAIKPAAKHLTIAAGSYVDLSISLAADPGANAYVYCSVIGDGLSLGGSTLYWIYPAWDTSRAMRIYAGSREGDSAAIVRLQYSRQPNIYHYIAVKIEANGDNDIQASPVLSSITKGATAPISIKVAPSTNITLAVSHRVATNNIMQAKAALQSLQRTMVVLPASALSYTNHTSMRYGYAHSQSTNLSAVLSFADGLARHNAGPYYTDVQTNTVAFEGDLAFIEARITAHDQSVFVPSSSYTYDHYYILHSLTGCSVAYPCDYAYASNYVARVHVYLCIAPLLCQRFETNYPDDLYGDPDLISAQLHDNQPWYYEAYGYGVWAGKYSSRNDVTTTVPGNQLGHPKYVVATDKLAAYRLVQVLDEHSPTERPTFYLGSEIGNYNFSFSSKSDFQTQELSYRNGDSIIFDGYYYHANQISIKYIVVVVDWAWQHLGGEQ